MPKMYSISKGEWVDVPESKVQEAYASGDLVFAKGERVNVALPDGRYGSVLGEEFGEAVRAGAVYDLPSERQERAETAEYEGKNVEALLLAAGRGLTFGLSDVALEKMGAYTDEELQNIEEIFLSPLFKEKTNKQLNIYKYLKLREITKMRDISLGGINNQNIKKLNMIKPFGFAGISYFENKKKGP